MSLVYTVIGIGEVGGTVASLINSNFSDITLHLNDVYPERNGKILDLQHAGACNGNIVHYNHPDSLSQSDFIVFAAGYSNVHGESRNSVAVKNRELVRSIFGNIVLKPEVVIIVITNPVEPVSFWIKEAIGDQINVIGTGTALDTFRLKFLLQQRFNCHFSEIETAVIGEHGQHMVPLFSSTCINGKPIMELRSEAELKMIETELKQSAFQIRATEKATKFGVAETTVFILKALLTEEGAHIPVSMPYADSAGRKLFLSLPAIINRVAISPVPFTMYDHEQDDLQKAIQSINSNLA